MLTTAGAELASAAFSPGRSHGAVLVVDDEQHCLDASLGACRLLSLSRAEVEGSSLGDLFGVAMSGRIGHFWQAFADTGGTAGPFHMELPDGRQLDVSLVLTANVVPGRHVIGIEPVALGPSPESAKEPFPKLALGTRVPSARERQILALLAEGETDSRIAAQLRLSPATVQTHVRNAKAKLGARTRAQAVALALTGGLISERS
ncbi:MAG: hypothetical protein QOJ01_37 [Solirubrobacterales bacterium]|nr:hypothetical protein [Solirubrobacterales bacterium]